MCASENPAHPPGWCLAAMGPLNMLLGAQGEQTAAGLMSCTRSGSQEKSTAETLDPEAHFHIMLPAVESPESPAWLDTYDQ